MSYLLGLISDVLGGLIGALIILWSVERKRKATIRVEPEEIKTEDGVIKYARVRVSNEGMPWYLAWAFDREAALQCHAWLRFYDESLRPIHYEEVPARWDEAQPPKCFPDGEGQLRFEHVEYAMDIASHTPRIVTLAVWLKGTNKSYVWNDDALARFNNGKIPRMELEKRKYIVRVRVRTLGRDYSKDFFLHADKGYDRFRLDTRA